MTEVLTYFIIAFVGLIIQYLIIYNAAGTATRKKQLRLQNQILLHIAKKLGVDQEHLDNMQKDNFNL